MNALQHSSFPISTYNSRQSVSHPAQIFGIIETGLNCGKRGHEVFDNIVVMLQSAREPHQPVADAELGARGRCEPLMRGRRRMGDQALGIAEIVADLDEPECVLEAEGAGLLAFDLERD